MNIHGTSNGREAFFKRYFSILSIFPFLLYWVEAEFFNLIVQHEVKIWTEAAVRQHQWMEDWNKIWEGIDKQEIQQTEKENNPIGQSERV